MLADAAAFGLRRDALFGFTAKTHLIAFIESFNGSLNGWLLNEELIVTLDDARRKLALWRCDDNNVRRHSSPENQTSFEAPGA